MQTGKNRKVDTGVADEPAVNFLLVDLDEHLAAMDIAGEFVEDQVIEPQEVVEKDVQQDEEEEMDSTNLGENQWVCSLYFNSWDKLVQHRSNDPKNSFVCSWKYKVGDVNWKKRKVDTGIADEPALNFLLIIKLKHNLNPEPGTTGPEYIFEKHYLIAVDKFVSSSKIKMRFIYNSVDYVAPFYKERITSVVRQGRPLLHDITCYTDLTAIMKKMPDGKSISKGLWLMHRHLSLCIHNIYFVISASCFCCLLRLIVFCRTSFIVFVCLRIDRQVYWILHKYIQRYILLDNTLPSLMSIVYTIYSIFILLFQHVICTVYCRWLFFCCTLFIVFVYGLTDKFTDFCISTFNGTYYFIIPYHHSCQVFTLYLFCYFSLLFVLYIAVHCILLHFVYCISLMDSWTSVDVSTSNYTLYYWCQLLCIFFCVKNFNSYVCPCAEFMYSQFYKMFQIIIKWCSFETRYQPLNHVCSYHCNIMQTWMTIKIYKVLYLMFLCGNIISFPINFAQCRWLVTCKTLSPANSWNLRGTRAALLCSSVKLLRRQRIPWSQTMLNQLMILLQRVWTYIYLHQQVSFL